MDVSEGKQTAVRGFHSEADQSEPMEHGQTRRPSLFVEPKVILENLALKSSAHLNRKRQHHSAHRDEALHMEGISDGKEADREGFISSLSQTSNHVMETGESYRLMPLYILNSPTSLSPSTPLVPAPRGVLKHSISQDSHSSMETVTKRRRLEDNRRVHFSEDVVAIAPPEPDSYATDSDEDSEEEKDSVAEQECEEEQAAEEVAAPARRPALPAWIQALKRRNTGRKHR
ncbi:uncharacterized protein zgc:113229 [Clinocottus analis]|uniref:uncharacterized protein zgc:113229 n=1 Tax=Clinocottus analis TaxID=304258 RepID=UPI0035BEC9FB